MTNRTEIHADGTFNDQTRKGAWAAVRVKAVAGQKDGTTSQEMELRAIIEAVKLAEGRRPLSAITKASSGWRSAG